jgi:hypothetical protein
MMAANISSAILFVLGSMPALFLAFGWIDWSAEQVAQYGVFLGVIAIALSRVLGVRVEAKVTPVANPRDDALVPLVPIANDGFED